MGGIQTFDTGMQLYKNLQVWCYIIVLSMTSVSFYAIRSCNRKTCRGLYSSTVLRSTGSETLHSENLFCIEYKLYPIGNILRYYFYELP